MSTASFIKRTGAKITKIVEEIDAAIHCDTPEQQSYRIANLENRLAVLERKVFQENGK